MSTNNKQWSLRRRIAGGVLKLLFGRPPQRPRLKPQELRRVLLIRHDRLGDYIITTPIVEAIRQRAPQAEIDVLGSPVNAEIIRNDPRIHELIIWGKTWREQIAAIRRCRERDYDLTLQLITRHTTNPAILASLCTPRGQTVGRGHSYNRGIFDYLARRTGEHLAAQTFVIFEDALDFGGQMVEMPSYSIRLDPEIEHSTTEELRQMGFAEGSYLLFNLSASEAYRTLGTRKSVEVARRLIERYAPQGLTVAVTGAPGEREMIETVARESGARVQMFPSILKAIVAVRHARMLISPDTGSVHIASAVGTPVVAYYGEFEKPSRWRPVGVPHRVVVTRVQNHGERVDINELMEAVEGLMEETEGCGTAAIPTSRHL